MSKFWREHLLLTALVVAVLLFVVVGVISWIVGWRTLDAYASAVIWAGVGAVVVGLLSALFSPEAPQPPDGRRPRLTPVGDSLMLLMLIVGLVAIVAGMSMRAL